MKTSLRLTASQKQQLKLNPMQVQFGRMLELTGRELEEEIRRTVDENPALEIKSPEQPESAGEQGDAEVAEGYDEGHDDLQQADYGSVDDIPFSAGVSRAPGWDTTRSDSVSTLYDFLLSQLAFCDLSDDERNIASYIAGNLDDSGYAMRVPLEVAEDILLATGVQPSKVTVGRAWDVVRSLDPAGVCAVDLRDCLLLQLDRRETDSPDVLLARRIVGQYFDLFSGRNFDQLRSALGTDDATLGRALNIITRLNPKPGLQYNHTVSDEASSAIIPDFMVETVAPGILKLTLLSSIPELEVEKTFEEFAEPKRDDRPDEPPSVKRARREAALFLRSKRDEARAFIGLMKIRQETLWRVMSAIVEIQKDFFLTDDKSRLKPMVLRDVAAITGDDLSVISRATSGKYVITAGGVYSLKSLFNEAAGTGDNTSAHKFVSILKDLIEGEDKQHPLSDEKLTALLRERGVEAARRTVAKYRERLGIPGAKMRRQL
ncbi:MAG: RNA polymerase factor sigma-54 [Muribaculaceae bacterium]|nr:RNA polymerase factor sigma-54 [Muribaculaceae bacterium]MDE6610791.1 RNA polymerase factor sigma-54 [Muribaculaceae bacterium]